MNPTWDTVQRELTDATRMPQWSDRMVGTWMDFGYTPRQAMRWIDVGVFTPGEAEDLECDGVSPRDDLEE
jgi:hypothetical protein